MTNETKIPITIGITCFNAEDTIARAIKSATEQDWLNCEIIVVDDCSTDNSVKKIKELQNKNERIRLCQHKENRGFPSALNTIVEHAQCQYVAFFDDDDASEVDRLTKQYNRLSQFEKEHPGVPVLCYAHRRVFIDGKEKPAAFTNAIGSCPPEPHGSMVADFLLWHKQTQGYVWGTLGSGIMMAPAKVLKEFSFDPNFRRCAEWDFAVRIALQGGYFIAVDEPLLLQHKTPTSDKAGRKPLDYGLMLRKKHKRYLQKNHVYLGAILQTYAYFYLSRGKPWKGRLYLALAYLLSPTNIMADKIAKWRWGRRRDSI